MTNYLPVINKLFSGSENGDRLPDGCPELLDFDEDLKEIIVQYRKDYSTSIFEDMDNLGILEFQMYIYSLGGSVSDLLSNRATYLIPSRRAKLTSDMRRDYKKTLTRKQLEFVEESQEKQLGEMGAKMLSGIANNEDEFIKERKKRLKKQGYKFDEKGRITEKPKTKKQDDKRGEDIWQRVKKSL